jgi:hypothetical protein
MAANDDRLNDRTDATYRVFSRSHLPRFVLG